MDNIAIENKRLELLARVWANSDYKRQFAADPKGVIAAEFAVDLPAGVDVKVLFDTPETEHLVLMPPEFLAVDDEADSLTRISAKAIADPAFKAALLADPRAAFRKYYQHALPDKPALKVVEQTADTYYIVIPQRPPSLSDAELDQVAGGVSTLQIVGYSASSGLIATGIVGTVFAGPLLGGPTILAGVAGLLADGDVRHGIATAAQAVGSGLSKAGHAVASIFHKRW